MASVTVISGFDGTGKNAMIDKIMAEVPGCVEFKLKEFSERELVYLYASECDLARTMQRRMYQNNNKIEGFWVDMDGIHVREDGKDKMITDLTEYQQYTLWLSFFLLEHFRVKGTTIVIRNFASGGDDFKVLDMLDFIRGLVVYHDCRFILSTNQSKNAALAGRKFSFLEDNYIHKDTGIRD